MAMGGGAPGMNNNSFGAAPGGGMPAPGSNYQGYSMWSVKFRKKTFIEITTIVVFQEAVVFEGRYLVAETQVNYVDY